MRIILSNPCPPIPDHSHDWCVYKDGHEEHTHYYGWGATPLDAGAAFMIEQFDNSASPLIAALKRALAVMDEPIEPRAGLDVADVLDEQMYRISGDIKEALRLLGEPS